MHGRVHKEVVQLNEESLWTRPIGRRENPLALARLGEVRQALLDGDGRRAHFLAELGSFGVPRSAGRLPDPWSSDAAQFRPSRGMGQ